MSQIEEVKTTLENLLLRFNRGEEMIKHGSSAPTYIPKTFFEQFFLYKNGATYRLYVYVDTWKYVALS